MDNTRPAGAPIVERVAGWPARHRIIVVVGWLALVVATFTLGQRLGTQNVNSYDPGQAGQAERARSPRCLCHWRCCSSCSARWSRRASRCC